MAKIFNKKMAEEATIDLTPMLDVVFIMLIFFIVTATFVSEHGFLVSRPPEKNSEPTNPEKNAVFVVSETNEIWFDGRRIDIRSVRANVERIKAENPNASVVVRAHELSSANIYVSIVDQAGEAINEPDFSASLVTYAD